MMLFHKEQTKLMLITIFIRLASDCNLLISPTVVIDIFKQVYFIQIRMINTAIPRFVYYWNKSHLICYSPCQFYKTMNLIENYD